MSSDDNPNSWKTFGEKKKSSGFSIVQLPEFVSWISKQSTSTPWELVKPQYMPNRIPKTSRFLDFLADASPAFSSAAPIERLVSFSWDKFVCAFIMLRDTLEKNI